MTIISDKERTKDLLHHWVKWSVCAPDPAEVFYYNECPFLDNRENENGDSKILNLYRDGTSLWRPWEHRVAPIKRMTAEEYYAIR